MGLTPFARRRSLKLRLNYIEEKIIAVQEELHNVEQTVSDTNPGLFANEHLGVNALKHQLEHLEKVAASIRKELTSIRGSR
jgi:prefoldin subunit 5